MKKTTTITAIGLLLAGEAQAGSAEVMVGKETTTLDAKLSGNIAGNAGFFFRARPTVGYDGAVSHFELADATYSLGKGIDAVAEVQMMANIDPRIGMQYYGENNNVAVYGLITVGTNYAELLAFAQYMPKLTDKVSGFAKIETVQDAGSQGYVWGTERLRLGVDVKGYKVGLGADITPPDKTVNPGLFVSKSL
ncbi:hypothetical protein COV16_01375 [Candidatus Woesearchaeota archaeon CG10_big_fil_rev_8_21_14_0_10_34_8]|nr:MAG: hypothetical protein COV16_01375 [Candidatus Woesearchaeota archaeon CG10_big_fil_rev_8_21_14_0_10_34_8]